MLAAATTGDQASRPVLDLVGDRPLQHLDLPNYDTDRNDDPGLTIVGTTAALTTTDPAGLQVWRLPTSVTTVTGADLTLWLAPLGPPAPGQIKVAAGLFECDAGRTSCTIVSTAVVRYVATDETFVPVTFDLGVTPTHEVAPGRRLELRFAVLNGSNNDVLVGYDAVATPSRLVVS